jgi:hypothetical protein
VSRSNDIVELTAPGRVSRRVAIQWVMAAVAVSSLPSSGIAKPAARAKTFGKGYGGDPDLMRVYKPGFLWPLTFTPAQQAVATALADVILPADEFGPAASTLAVPAMVDEWISAPYPQQQGDKPVILDGVIWMEAESNKRFGKGFVNLNEAQKHAICDDICFSGSAKPEFRKAAEFFNRFRSLCASAYYATPEGWKAIGYVGNVPLPSFDGPPPEVLEKLGITQTVV